MWKTLCKALKIKDIRNRLLYSLAMLFIIRLGCNIPIPGIDASYIKTNLFDQIGTLGSFLNQMTGGSMESMSILALSITPYITSSIIMELMTIAIPKLEELQREGEEGRKKMAEYTRYLTVALALIESIAMSVGFRGMFTHYGPKSVIVSVALMTAGSAFLMWIGERITEKGVGNGISIVLLINILSSLPSDLSSVYETFASGKAIAVKVLILAIIAACIIAMTVFVVLLNGAERRIPVQYSAKTQGRRMNGGQASNIPLKVNTAGVIPVIFASSLLSFPVVIGQLLGVTTASIGGKILAFLNQSNWVKPATPIYSLGLIIYILLIILFAYFYTSITFNPLEVANNMKKSAGFIPGIRPGKPTSDYLQKILNYIIFIGAVGLVIIAVIPIIISGVFSLSRLSFTGNSLIIIVGVILETVKGIESQMLVRNYKGFLSD